MISRRMDIQCRNPLDTSLQRLDQFLSGEIVESDITLGCSEEMWFLGVECDSLDLTLGLSEW